LPYRFASVIILAVLPVLFRLGPFTFYTYTVLVDVGIAAGLAWLYLRAPRVGPPAPVDKRTRWLDAGLAATLGGFVGARLLYAVVNGGYYFNHLGEIFEVWLGGLAWPGALLGGLAGMWMYGRRKREPLLPILDTLALPVTLLGLLSWGGCLAASCAYGYEVAPGQLPAWMVLDAPDLYGLTAPRFPTQVLGLAWSVIALATVWGVKDRAWPLGAQFAYALSLVALGAFLLGFTRGDPMPLVSGYRLDVVGGALVLVLSTAAWAWLVLRARTPAQPRPETVANP
jgi:phosphatidylglycerol:prolipoprotein diacylglycerol transferase